jgi:hypothetical protein
MDPTLNAFSCLETSFLVLKSAWQDRLRINGEKIAHRPRNFRLGHFRTAFLTSHRA